MKHLTLYVVILSCSLAWGQQSANTPNTSAPATAEVLILPDMEPVPAQATQVPATTQAQPQVQTQPAVQQTIVVQPKTNVEAAPLVKSRAEQLRDARKGVEIETEQKIVEKLEESRMQDERDRANRLFGDRFERPAEEEPELEALSKVSAAPAAVVPVQEVVPVTQIQEDNTDEKLDSMKNDIIESVRSDLKAAKAEQKKPEDRTYIGALVGGGEYPGLVNVTANNSFGFVIGNESERFIIEGAYIYSNFFVDESILVFKDMDQHNIMFTAKYSILDGRVRPQVGAAGSYTQRNYTDLTQGFNGFPNLEGAEYESTAFDVGLVLALDVSVKDNFILGVDYRYMTNLTYNDDFNTPFRNAAANSGVTQLIEDAEYQIFSVSGKVTF